MTEVNPPPIKDVLLNKVGQLSQVWVMFFQNLFNKVTQSASDIEAQSVMESTPKDVSGEMQDMAVKTLMEVAPADNSGRITDAELRVLLEPGGLFDYRNMLNESQVFALMMGRSDHGVTGKLTMRPSLVAGRIVAGGGVPTSVVIGSHAGYSLPVWSTPANQYEELYFREYVAGRWDGISDIVVSVVCCLASAEDVGDNFKLELSWENKSTGSGVVSTSTTDVYAEQAVATGREAQYSIYKINFTVDWDGPAVDIAANDHIGFRLRRVDATDPDISGEVIILDCVLTYSVNKMYKVA